MNTQYTRIIAVVAMMALVWSAYGVSSVRAAATAAMSDVMSRQKISAYSNHSVNFTTPTGVASGQTITFTLPNDFDGTTDPQGTLDFSDVDLEVQTTPDGVCGGTAQTLVAAAPGATEWSAVFSGTASRVLTLTSGGASATVPAGGEICIKVGEHATGGAANSQYRNTTTIGSKLVAVTAGPSDSGSLAVAIVDEDQLAITAAVTPSITFDIDTAVTNTESAGPYGVSLGNLAAGTLTTSNGSINSIWMDLSTNAGSGAVVTVQGVNGGLSSPSASKTITLASAKEDIAAGAEGVGLCVAAVSQSAGGALAPSAQYNSNGASNCTIANGGTPNVGRIETTPTVILNTSSNPIDGGRAQVLVKAAISTSTPAAADYAETLTFIATGTF